MAPLYLEARVLDSKWGNGRFSAFQDELQACVSCICYFLLSADDRIQFLKTLKSLISPAPTLERLSLTGERHWITEAVPETLFGGATPRLSCLELRDCGISWKTPLLRGLRYLDIRSPSPDSIASGSVWLDALDEMPQLKTLTLRGASPTAGPFPFDVKRAVTLPSLTHFDISESPRDCAFALAHLDLPALTYLGVNTFSFLLDGSDVREVLLYIAQHAHGSQDTHPLQSVLIRVKKTRADILAWTVPNIGVEVPVHGSTSLAATAPARVALSLRSKNWNRFDYHNKILSMAMAAVPLDGLVTLITQDFLTPPFQQFWLPTLPRLPLLRRVRLTSIVATKFIDWLQGDKGAREDPLLPSLKELVLVDAYLYEDWTLRLCEALMKRVEQGVPLEMLDLRTCRPDPGYSAAIRIIGEIVVDIVGPEETVDARAQIISMWDRLARGSIVGYDDSGEESQLDTDDDDDDSDTSSDGEDDEEE